MSTVALEAVIEAQAALIAALDGGHVEVVEAATARLSVALAALRSEGAWRGDGAVSARVDHALRMTDAARARVNYLADRNRQRLGHIARARGGGSAATYDARGKARLSLVAR